MEQAIADWLPTSESLAWNFFTRLPSGDLDELKSVTAEALVISAGRWIDPYCASRGYDPWDPRDPSKPEKHWGGFAIKRMKGALMDWARGRDLMSRSGRHKIKALRQAEDDGHRDEASQAAAAGLSVEQARQVRAAGALSVCSLDDQDILAGGQYAGNAVLDIGADTESVAAVNVILGRFLGSFGQLDAETQVVLALRFHHELEFSVIAERLRCSAYRVEQLHDTGVLAIHRALLVAVSS